MGQFFRSDFISSLLNGSSHVQELVNLIHQYSPKRSHFLLLPSFDDISSLDIDSVQAITQSWFSDPLSKLPNVTCLMNGARIRYQSIYDILFIKYSFMSIFSKQNLFPSVPCKDLQSILWTCTRQATLVPTMASSSVSAYGKLFPVLPQLVSACQYMAA